MMTGENADIIVPPHHDGVIQNIIEKNIREVANFKRSMN